MDDVLAELARGQRQGVGERGQAELLPGDAELDSVAPTEGHALAGERVIADLDARRERRPAPLLLGAVAGDHCPRDDAATGAAFDGAGAAGGEQPAGVADGIAGGDLRGRRRGEWRGHDH